MQKETKNLPLPLEGIKVIEFSHMVMGPSAGVILADLGAEVIKVEPIGGDKTRKLPGSGAGYFAMYNRNKRSVCIDMKSPAGKKVVNKLVADADIVLENFRSGALEKLGYGYDALSTLNPRLIYCSARGFLKGPYDHRTALDEVVQMMGGLAYMTGPPGKPLRAGASVIDVMGGMFGVIGILSALEMRHRTGEGQNITSSLFESTVFLMGQHMAQHAVTGKPAAPMPARISAWAIYDKFDTADGDTVFVAVVSDTQWKKFCAEFGLEDFAQDNSMATNAGRVELRDKILPRVSAQFSAMTTPQLLQKLDDLGLPYAPICRPEDLTDDIHLKDSGGLLEVRVSEGNTAELPALPLQIGDRRLGIRVQLPEVGEHTEEVLLEAGYSASEIEQMIDTEVVAQRQ